MKMILKNKKIKKSKEENIDKNKKHFSNILLKLRGYLTYKNLFLFLVSFLCFSIILGILFYLYMKNSDKLAVNNNISTYFNNNISSNYLKNLFTSLSTNFFNAFLIWILGISVIGLLVVIFILFIESFSLGFSMAALIGKYRAKGILGIISYLFPTKIIYLLGIFLISYFAIRFSILLIRFLFFKANFDVRSYLKKYLKNLLLVLIILLVASLCEVFISPFMIKLFTFFNK